MESSTDANSIYIDLPASEVAAYVREGDSLSEFTLDAQIEERLGDGAWRGFAGPYPSGLFYQSRHRECSNIQVVDWYCGHEYGRWHHVYLFFLIPSRYFGSDGAGTYCHWISFVDPARATPMVAQALPTVHRADLHSLKAQLERRAGRPGPVPNELMLDSHTIYVDAPAADVVAYLADASNVAEWTHPTQPGTAGLRDEFGRLTTVRTAVRDFGSYQMVEHDTEFVSAGDVVRAPFFVIPASFAFGQSEARGVVLHRLTAWGVDGDRKVGKQFGGLYDAELVRTKRVLETNAGNWTSFPLGCSYRPAG